MKKLIIYLTLLLGVISYGLSGKTVSASCGGQYESPCQSYSMLVDKMVQKGLPIMLIIFQFPTHAINQVNTSCLK